MKPCNNNILNLGSISEQAYRIKKLEDKIEEIGDFSDKLQTLEDLVKALEDAVEGGSKLKDVYYMFGPEKNPNFNNIIPLESGNKITVSNTDNKEEYLYILCSIFNKLNMTDNTGTIVGWDDNSKNIFSSMYTIYRSDNPVSKFYFESIKLLNKNGN